MQGCPGRFFLAGFRVGIRPGSEEVGHHGGRAVSGRQVKRGQAVHAPRVRIGSRFKEGRHNLGTGARHRQVQGAPAVAIDHVGVCSLRQQRSHRRRIALKSRELEGRKVGGAAPLDECRDHVGNGPAAKCGMKRGPAVVALRQGFRASREQPPDHPRDHPPAPETCDGVVQRRVTLIVQGVRIRSSSQKMSGHDRVAVHHSTVKRRHAFVIHGLRMGTGL